MNKIFLLFFLFLPALARAHKDTLVNKSAGINFTAAYSNSENLFAIPNFTFTYNKHTISLGPTFALIDYSPLFIVVAGAQTKPVESFKLNGISGAYQFSLSKPQKHFNLYLQYEFIYHQFSVSTPYINYEEKNLEQFLGCGLRSNIFKTLYLNTSAGAGYYFINSDSGQDIFKSHAPGWLLKFGIGYIFRNTARKFNTSI